MHAVGGGGWGGTYLTWFFDARCRGMRFLKGASVWKGGGLKESGYCLESPLQGPGSKGSECSLAEGTTGGFRGGWVLGFRVGILRV